MEKELNQYFSSFLKDPRSDQAEDIKKITNHIPKNLTKDYNKMLMRKVSLEEVEEVVMHMPNGKSPRLDGFTIDFYKVCWPILKHHVYALVKESKIQKYFLKVLNTTFITLIPKGDSIESSYKFLPIALCNVIYKMISEVLANRLKTIFPLLISHHQ